MFNLQKGEGFSDNSCLISKNKIYALQNIVD